MWLSLLHPLNIPFDRSYLLFEALELPSCRSRWAELFPGSIDSDVGIASSTRMCVSRRSFV